MSQKRLFPLALLLALASGCDNKPDSGSPARNNSPSQNGATSTRPTTARAVATQPVPSYLYLTYVPLSASDEPSAPVIKQFPAAMLKIRARSDDLIVQLYSDDPKEAINKDWMGDRYYFLMPLQADSEGKSLDHKQWSYNASPSEKEDQGNGVFLKGDRLRLEPVHAVVRFQGEAPHVTVEIAGEFVQIDAQDTNAKPQHVQVNGVLIPQVRVEK